MWKWIAGTILTCLIFFLTPSIGWFIDSRDQVSRSEFTVVSDRQQIVLQRLAAIDVRLNQIDMDQAELKILLTELEKLLREHDLGLRK